MASNAVKLLVNIPETMALEFSDGLPVASKFGGDQVMFSLTDGRKLYLPPFVACKIADAKLQPGEVFTLCKREILSGNRRVVEYQIDAAVNPPTPAAANGNGRNGLHAVESPKGDTTVVTPAAAPVFAGPPCGAAHPEFTPAPASALAMMKSAGCAAVDAALQIEEYARSKGMTDFVLGSENIQKIAVTLFLEMSRKAGRAA